MKKTITAVLAVQLVIAYEWLRAGAEKVSSPDFVEKMGGTLAYFASKNPFGWYKEFLLGFAANHATLFGNLIQWGETAVGIALAASVGIYAFNKLNPFKRAGAILAVTALAGAALMNANFYFAAGWTSPSTHGINMVMFWIEAALLYFWASELLSASNSKQ